MGKRFPQEETQHCIIVKFSLVNLEQSNRMLSVIIAFLRV
ncbi:hypothetical protein OIU76_014171 [Salix suchowensis]|nr:hypothetical protein OIU76_014171 [Salix suchowensis]